MTSIVNYLEYILEVIGRFIIVFFIWCFFFWNTKDIVLNKIPLILYSILLLLLLVWVLIPIQERCKDE